VEPAREPYEFRLSSAELVPGAVVVTLSGELDLANAQRIDEELDELHDAGARQVVVDLLDAPFLESTVLGVLLHQARRLRDDGGELIIVTDDVRVLRVFEITGLLPHFTFRRTLASAIESVLTAAVR
jgi:anti-sigma B factor antagonist